MPSPDVLYLPGMMCDERLFSAQTAALPNAAWHADTTRADDFATMAAQVLSEAPPRFAAVGLSMGGILAFEIWRQAPERVTHLALIDTNPYADAPERRSLRLKQIEVALSGGLRELAVESLKPMYLASANRDDEGLLDVILDMALDLGPEVFERQSVALANRMDSAPTLNSIDCPTLVMCGIEDRLCPVAYHEFMAARIPEARFRVIEACGHLATLESPAVVNEELAALLSR